MVICMYKYILLASTLPGQCWQKSHLEAVVPFPIQRKNGILCFVTRNIWLDRASQVEEWKELKIYHRHVPVFPWPLGSGYIQRQRGEEDIVKSYAKADSLMLRLSFS